MSASRPKRSAEPPSAEAEHQAVVEHEQHARLTCQLAQLWEEALGRRGDHAGVLHRLDDDRCHFAGVARERLRVAVDLAEGCERHAPRHLALALQAYLEVIV